MTQATPPPAGSDQPKRRTKPPWLKVKLPTGEAYRRVRGLVSEHKLHTICESGNCPNMGECWGEGTATFMILGNVCTRSCGFCNVSTGRPEEADPFEPGRVANSVKLMEVKHAVITSVTAMTWQMEGRKFGPKRCGPSDSRVRERPWKR